MGVYKRGGVWWGNSFKFDGESVRETTRQTNKRVAEQIEAARKTALAKGEVGLEEKKHVPTLKCIWAHSSQTPSRLAAPTSQLRSVSTKTNSNSLLEFNKLASARLDRIG